MAAGRAWCGPTASGRRVDSTRPWSSARRRARAYDAAMGSGGPGFTWSWGPQRPDGICDTCQKPIFRWQRARWSEPGSGTLAHESCGHTSRPPTRSRVGRGSSALRGEPLHAAPPAGPGDDDREHQLPGGLRLGVAIGRYPCAVCGLNRGIPCVDSKARWVHRYRARLARADTPAAERNNTGP
jgi:hypothetical protein